MHNVVSKRQKCRGQKFPDKKNGGQVSQFSKLEPRDLGFRESSPSYVDWHHFGVQKVKGGEVTDRQSHG